MKRINIYKMPSHSSPHSLPSPEQPLWQPWAQDGTKPMRLHPRQPEPEAPGKTPQERQLNKRSAETSKVDRGKVGHRALKATPKSITAMALGDHVSEGCTSPARHRLQRSQAHLSSCLKQQSPRLRLRPQEPPARPQASLCLPSDP